MSTFPLNWAGCSSGIFACALPPVTGASTSPSLVQFAPSLRSMMKRTRRPAPCSTVISIDASSPCCNSALIQRGSLSAGSGASFFTAGLSDAAAAALPEVFAAEGCEVACPASAEAASGFGLEDGPLDPAAAGWSDAAGSQALRDEGGCQAPAPLPARGLPARTRQAPPPPRGVRRTAG